MEATAGLGKCGVPLLSAVAVKGLRLRVGCELARNEGDVGHCYAAEFGLTT